MAIYHLSCQVISRKAGRSSVAASAYRAGARIADARTGMTYDFRSKTGVEESAVLLPDGAPEDWRDRAELWNAVESAERNKNARLCREFNVALPVELSESERWELAKRFAKSLANQGMCVDLAMHNPKDGHNPHFHAMTTVRPCDGSGFLPKARALYLMRSDAGSERWATARECRGLGPEWAKVYTYKDGRKRTMAEAEADGLDPTRDRKRKQPVSRKESSTEAWDSVEALEGWREAWQDMANEALERSGSAERIDHRSNEARGIARTPTVHEGPAVRAMEDKARREAAENGFEYEPVTDRGRENEKAKAEAERDERVSRESESEARRIEGERSAALAAFDAESTREVAELYEMRDPNVYLVPRVSVDTAMRDLAEIAEHAPALGEHDADEVLSALSPVQLGAHGPDKVARAAGEATEAIAEAWSEYGYDEYGRKDPPTLLALLLLAAERIRSLLARLVVLMEAEIEDAREHARDVTLAEAAKAAVERESRNRQRAEEQARRSAGSAQRPLADEPGVWEVAPPEPRKRDGQRQD